MSLVRPSWHGPVGPGLVSPDWSWVWGNTRFVIPLDSLVERVTQQRMTVSAGELAIGSKGTAYRIDATTDHAYWNHSPSFRLGVTETWTLGLAVNVTGSAGSSPALIAHRTDGATDGSWGLYHVTSGDMRFQIRAGSSNSSAVFSSAFPGNGFHTFMVVRRKGGNYDLYIDGKFHSTATNATALATTGTHELIVGALTPTITSKTLGDYYTAFAVSDFAATVAQARQYHQDPFGFLRPASWGPELAAATGTAHTLTASSTATIIDVVDEADTTIDLHLSVDDDPATPNDADWINNTDDAGQAFVGLTNLPADFGTADSAEITVRYRGQEYGAGNIKLHVQLFRADETTPLSDEVEATLVTGDSVFTNATVAFTGLDTAATKSVWDNAKLRCRWEAV